MKKKKGSTPCSYFFSFSLLGFCPYHPTPTESQWDSWIFWHPIPFFSRAGWWPRFRTTVPSRFFFLLLLYQKGFISMFFIRKKKRKRKWDSFSCALEANLDFYFFFLLNSVWKCVHFPLKKKKSLKRLANGKEFKSKDTYIYSQVEVARAEWVMAWAFTKAGRGRHACGPISQTPKYHISALWLSNIQAKSTTT